MAEPIQFYFDFSSPYGYIASQRIEIRPSAKVIGNLTAPVLVVHEGALFEGHCSMQPEGSQGSKVTVFAKDERVAVAGVQKQA